MNNIELKDKNEFKAILSKPTIPNMSEDFTDAIMEKVIAVNAKQKLFNKCIKLSWFFIIIAVTLSIKTVLQISYFELEFDEAANSILPQALKISVYILLSVLSGLFFYQLNNLLTCRFSFTKK